MALREMTVDELAKRLKEPNPPELLDVREAAERTAENIGGLHIPLAELSGRLNEIPRDQEVVVYCRSGGRSAWAVAHLARSGFERVTNLKGGLEMWKRRIGGGAGSGNA